MVRRRSPEARGGGLDVVMLVVAVMLLLLRLIVLLLLLLPKMLLLLPPSSPRRLFPWVMRGGGFSIPPVSHLRWETAVLDDPCFRSFSRLYTKP